MLQDAKNVMGIIKVCVNITIMLYNIHTTLTLLWVESLLWMHSRLTRGQYECCVKSLLYYIIMNLNYIHPCDGSDYRAETIIIGSHASDV